METSGRPLLPFQGGKKKKWIYWKRYLCSEYVQFTKTQTCKTNKWTGRKCKTMWKRRVQQCAVGGNSCPSEKKWLAVFMSTYFTLKGIIQHFIQRLQNATGQGQVVISTATMWICLKYWAIPRKTSFFPFQYWLCWKFSSVNILTKSWVGYDRVLINILAFFFCFFPRQIFPKLVDSLTEVGVMPGNVDSRRQRQR